MSEERKNEDGLRKPGRPRKAPNTNKNIIENIFKEDRRSAPSKDEAKSKPTIESKPTIDKKPAVDKKPLADKKNTRTPVAAKADANTNRENSRDSRMNDSDDIIKFKQKKPRAAQKQPNSPAASRETSSDMPTSVAGDAKSGAADNRFDAIESKPKASRAKPRVAATSHKENLNASSEKTHAAKFEHVSTEYIFDLNKESQVQEIARPKKGPGRPVKKQDKRPVLSLNNSTSSSATDREKTTPETQEKLAIQSHGRKSLDRGHTRALEKNDKRPVPATINTTQVAGNSEEALSARPDNTRAESGYKARAHKGRNTRTSVASARRTKSEDAKSTGLNTADFVAGVHGTSAYVGAESLGAFGEKGALGVMGIIEEAPSIDALLPLVTDSESESKNPRRSRSRRRPKDKPAKKNADAAAPSLKHEFDEPIAEGGELSLLEAGATVKKHAKSKKESSVKAAPVNRILYVSSVPDEQVEVVITENGVVSEYFVEMAHQAKIRGNIYKGVINNVDTNLQAAFVNFGSGKNGFLQIDEVHPEYWLTHHTEGGKYPPIQKVLKIGQEVLVQVVKEPSGSKGAFLTTWISLAGRFIVLTPGQEQIGVSRKVEDNVERSRLRDLLVGINPGEDMGVIIRTASEGASKTNIQSDLKFLKRAWIDIQNKVVEEVAPCLIYQEADLASRAVRDYLSDDIDEVWVDSEEVRDALHDLVSIIFPKDKDVLKLHKDTRQSLWERFNILRQLEEVTKREVILPSGGRLVFDQTEALMAIDINSGKTQGKINFESMVFRTNMEAVDAIARHLRLRDIGGQVVIDFIEMRDRGHCREVEKSMSNAMKRDRARHDVGRLSSFGLLELVRQRTGTSAISISSEPCPHCRGTGFRRNLEWQSQGVLREIKSKLSGKNVPACYVHSVEQEVAFYLLNKKRDRLSELESKFSVKIEIQMK